MQVIFHSSEIRNSSAKPLSTWMYEPNNVEVLTNISFNFRLIVGDKGSVPLGEVLPVVFANLPLKEDTQEYPVVYRALEAAYQEIKASGILGQNLAKVCSMMC